MIVLAVALAGGVGAVLRFVVDALVARWHDRSVPLGTIVVNVTGSFLLGLLVALVHGHAGLDALVTVLGTGLLGGYTSFSTASVEAVTIALRDGARAAVTAVGHAVVMLLVSLAAAGLGLWLGAGF
ncbi:fluoride efflux transporter FluC [Ruania zhangjianzhongii]|uniref:fluoride efflux transporter FluC n=1 Tax=Ruania zhangjianzhongii TaxID=2603206 RepID=UPI0011C70FCF|nr:CrcB family protein [Ruania zhangjianzhongii]